MNIVISSGHGKYIRGASDIIDEVDEARKVVNQVAAFLETLDVRVEVFHDDISTTQSENLDRIVQYHNSQERDFDVSVHFNAFERTTKPMGTECLYISQSELADDMATAIARASGLIDRGPKHRTDLAFLNNTDAPAILIEVCFVDSQADVDIYTQKFLHICEAIATTIAGKEIDIEPPAESLFYAAGKCSHFGGPDDTGVSPDEGLAFFFDYDEAPHLFLAEQPDGTTGLARRLNPNIFYVACRWDYDVTPKTMLAEASHQALVRAKGKEFHAWPADWGPHGDTDRIADLSPALMSALGLTTDDEVEVIYPA